MSRDLVSVYGFNGDVFETQRRLRSQLLDRPVIRQASARDLAAHMLLTIDDLPACWSLATDWLRAELGCHRVDTGFGVAQARDYFPGYAEAKNSNYDVPSFGGSSVYNFDPAMQAMWKAPRPLIFADIKQDRRISKYLRRRISTARTKSKFAGALRVKNGSYGLICADWTEHFAPHKSGLYDCFEQTVSDVLSPIIAVSKEIADTKKINCDVRQEESGSINITAFDFSNSVILNDLTVSELEVARLVAQGLSYKQIARTRGRSFSTIDHQLRSIRKKTKTSNMSALVSLLAKIEASGQ